MRNFQFLIAVITLARATADNKGRMIRGLFGLINVTVYREAAGDNCCADRSRRSGAEN